jgi:uncharacterized protein (TIGR03435 family)
MERTIGLAALTMSAVFGQSFEVASVKLNAVSALTSMTQLPGGERFKVRNMPPLWLIGAAYNVPNRQISGFPQWMLTESYDIDAKAEHPVNREQMLGMLRTLLEDRFKLVVRRETKDIKAYALVVAKGGPKFDENRDGAELFMDRTGQSKWTFHNMPMTLLTNVLSAWVDDTVVDRTGLKGNYDFELEVWLPHAERPQDPNAPSVYTALQEQLRLKLESRKGPVELLVIEHVERPSGN